MAGEAQKSKLIFYKALTDISNQIHAAENLDEILINLEESILSLFDAERLTLYAVDDDTQEIFSRFFSKGDSEPTEIRLSIDNKSLAGFVAKNGQPVNVANAYDADELSMINRELVFDYSWDEGTGFITRQVLVVPVIQGNQVVGVIQLINKKSGDRFTIEDQSSVIELARVVGIAISNQWKLSLTDRKKGRLDYLVDQNIVTQLQLDQAINKARSHRVDVELILMGDLSVSKTDMGKALSDYYGCELLPMMSTTRFLKIFLNAKASSTCRAVTGFLLATEQRVWSGYLLIIPGDLIVIHWWATCSPINHSIMQSAPERIFRVLSPFSIETPCRFRKPLPNPSY
jgi:hypothetical protein